MFRKEEIRREVIRENFPVQVTGKFFPYKKNISLNKVVRGRKDCKISHCNTMGKFTNI